MPYTVKVALLSVRSSTAVRRQMRTLTDGNSTVSRVDRRLRKEPKKDLPMSKSDLGSNAVEFYFIGGGRKQLF